MITPISTSTTLDSAKRSLSFWICGASVMGSPVLPSKISTATGQPARLHKSPNTIWNRDYMDVMLLGGTG